MDTNAFDLYSAAVENAEQNDVSDVDADYFDNYAFNACDISISREIANKMAQVYMAWQSEEAKDSNKHYYIVQEPLADIEL